MVSINYLTFHLKYNLLFFIFKLSYPFILNLNLLFGIFKIVIQLNCFSVSLNYTILSFEIWTYFLLYLNNPILLRVTPIRQFCFILDCSFIYSSWVLKMCFIACVQFKQWWTCNMNKLRQVTMSVSIILYFSYAIYIISVSHRFKHNSALKWIYNVLRLCLNYWAFFMVRRLQITFLEL